MFHGQLKVELLSSKGEIIARSSQPCMLRFRSQPIRLARTFVMSVPLVAGIANEAQTMRIDALMHQEKGTRTKAVRVTLIPRAQTRLLPQLYEAEIVINSKPPWTKRMAYNWKWTLCVWTSMYLFVPILIALLFRPFLFPYVASRTVVEDQNTEIRVVQEEVAGRRLRERRNKPRRRNLKVELLSSKGEIIARSSQPCMLRFRSQPIRLARTFVMSVPLVAGIANEAQTMRIDALMHQEKGTRTKAVRVTLIPRAQTRLLPQLYEAEIVINSKPPWTKRMAYNWKWTLCVWTSMYLFVPILIALLCCFRPFLFPYVASRTVVEDQNTEIRVVQEEVAGRRLRERRNKARRRNVTTTQEIYIL
ncbi:hypothetical protein F2Q69_00018888 [Brassica cretica]|uniref:Seipin-1 n=1 Tax=Brassica cretica TaxID=69181 RepID=A0A8S9Q1N5_BRACR|nr:hypothetical protein F2Q69_00018888 [Brassica cretica]